MKKLYLLFASMFFCLSVFSQGSECDSLTSPCLNTFSGKSYFFDIQASSNININHFSMMAQNCGARDISIYYRTNSYIGHETDATDWVLAGSATNFTPACAGGCPIPETIIPVLVDVCIPAGQTFGFYIVITGGTGTIEGHTFSTEGTVIAEDSHLKIFAGKGSLNTGAFDLSVGSDRSWQGSVKYSCTCIVGEEEHSLNTVFSTSLQPNPANDDLQYIINSSKESWMEITITDISGKQIGKQKKQIVRGKNNFILDLSQIPGGLYFISVSDDFGLKSVNKFVRY